MTTNEELRELMDNAGHYVENDTRMTSWQNTDADSPFLEELTDCLQIFSPTNPVWGIMESVVVFEDLVINQKNAPSDHDSLDRMTYRELLRILGDYVYSIVEGDECQAVSLIETRIREVV